MTSPQAQSQGLVALMLKVQKPVRSAYHMYASVTGFLQALLFAFLARSVEFLNNKQLSIAGLKADIAKSRIAAAF